MKNTKELKQGQAGITLIALVITIIVLLILAGVSMAMLIGNNGILTQAQNAKERTKEAGIIEKVKLAQMEASMHLDSYEYTDKEGNTVKIPSGFAVSNIEGENLVSKGLVIIGENGNEYVWIPCTEGTYKRETENWKVKENNGIRAIKDELTLTGITPTKEEIDNGITEAILNEIVQQVKNEIKSIKNNGGYYIGRYEVGKESNKAVVKANQTPYTLLIWSDAYKEAKAIDVGNNAKSYLCSSYAWDTAINFIQTHSIATNYATSILNFNGNWYDCEVKDKKGNIIKKASNGAKLNTGLTTSYANIYDMGGNVMEFTTELKPGTDNTIILRGGHGMDNVTPAGARVDAPCYFSYSGFGFRSTLFLE